MGPEFTQEPLTLLPLRDETRTAYILQAVESAWEGVDRQKIKDIKDPSRAKDSNNEVTITAEPVSEMPLQLENSEEDEEVHIWTLPLIP